MKIPKRLRKLRNASGKECCAICNTQQFLIEHYINGRDIPNYNAPWNTCHICDNDHRLVHEGKIIISGWFDTTEGRKLIWHYKDEKSDMLEDSNPYIIRRNISS